MNDLLDTLSVFLQIEPIGYDNSSYSYCVYCQEDLDHHSPDCIWMELKEAYATSQG